MSLSQRWSVAGGVVMALLAGAASPADAGAPVRPHHVLRAYQPSAAVIANPDRGLYHYTESHALADGSGFDPLDTQTLERWRTQDHVTVVYRVYYLERYVAQSSLDAAYLAAVGRDLDTARSAGVRLIIRFAYSADSSADATLPVVLSHVDQIAPVLNAGADVIAVLQAGFIGQWGEWYYSDHFTSTPGEPWLLSAADWSARWQVLNEVLAKVSPTVFVQVRYPAIKQRLLAGGPASVADRVGIHDDCFLASADDYGTFAGQGDYAWLADQTRTVPMGGETCATDVPRSLWPSAEADLTAYHWSFLNADYQSDVLSSWGTQGRAAVERRLGYRIRLLRGRYVTSAVAGASTLLSLTLTNDGFAAPYRSRGALLVLQTATSTVTRPVALDLRSLAAGSTRTFQLSVTAPTTPGSYALYLALPDSSARLVDSPAYSLELANAGLWSASRGWNSLQQRLQVVQN